MPEAYHDPVARLLTLGDVRGQPEWRDYPALGLTAEHVPELVRMALDEDLHWADGESAEAWAPLHAWRALGQLRAEAAVAPLLPLLDRIDEDEDDWAQGDLPEVFGMIGPAALPGLRDFMADAGHGEWARIAAGESLVKMAERFPEIREQAAAIITEQLRHFADQERTFNAFLVNDLCDLKAVASAAVIEQAYAAGAVDLSVLGDWEEAQIMLGLLDKRLTSAPNFFAAEFWPLPLLRRAWGGESPAHKADKRKKDKPKKARRKQAKASRRRNRKR
jgi:HEAT repeat protein